MIKLLKFEMGNAKLYYPSSFDPKNSPSISLFPRKLSLYQTLESKKLTLNTYENGRYTTIHVLKNSEKSVYVQEKEETSYGGKVDIEGKVVLKKKTTSSLKDRLKSSVLFRDDGLVGKKISFQLVSAADDDTGKVGKRSYLDEEIEDYTSTNAEYIGLGYSEFAYRVTFDWDEKIGLPGALKVRNESHKEIYLKTITLKNVPNHGTIHFPCNSWVYPAHYYDKDRIFFTNKTYLPDQTPKSLCKYREEELEILRGKGKENRMLKEWDRVYDYAYYNDLGEPKKGKRLNLLILGGTAEYPYPRRGRTSRPPSKKDPKFESRLPLIKSLNLYIPRDEKFGHVKFFDFTGDAVKSLSQTIFATLNAYIDLTPKRFGSFKEVMKLYEGAITLPDNTALNKLRKKVPTRFLKALFRSDGAALMNYPKPDIVKVDEWAWRTDEEFARQLLAGTHPLMIRRLEEFPPVSKLDPKAYGNQNSTITKKCVEENLDGLSVEEAIQSNRLFILDHHDTIMPLLRRIIDNTDSKVYASRTLLFLKTDGTLKPLVIELSSPNPCGDAYGAISKTYTPFNKGVEADLWLLAKTYVTINDSAYHQLISHWLHTHAVIEPFIIATHRQLSKLHPIHKLLHPHFRDTMTVNTIARQIALNPDGLFDQAVFPRQYVTEWTSLLYKDWVFTEQALPADLIKRGMAVKDPESPHGCKLIIADYPYAVDGLEIWSAIETWVKEYCSFYYKSDDMIANDPELQLWWKEVLGVGHGDTDDEKWPDMKTFDVLTETCTTIIWVASALHAVLNFGQYPYGGYMPNRPTISYKLMPEEKDYCHLKKNAECVFLETVTSQLRTALCISVIELISRHSEDEVYLGQREPGWTSDDPPVKALEEFNKKLEEIEAKILERNKNPELKNRVGPARLPFTLLCRSSGVGITGRGIPNSISL